MLEKQIQDGIIQLFESYGLYIQRINSGLAANFHTGNIMRLADRGHSDLVGSDKQNRICFIEVKSATGKLSVEQIAFLREQNRKGRRWLVCISMDDALRFLDDDNYHGQEKHVIEVLDATLQFIPSQNRGKKQKMTMRTFLEHDRWADKK